jgi:hypothetical protein
LVEVSRALLFATAVALIAGCSTTVADRAVRVPADAVERALPAPSELGRVLGLPIESDAAPQVGGSAVLRADDASVPLECAGVTHAGHRRTYQNAPLRSVARGLWTTIHGSDDRVDVVISVSELDSSASARSWYAKTSAQWLRCRGVTVTEHTNAVSLVQNISRVRDSGETLTADLSVSTDNGIMAGGLNRRAFIATSQYLVDAEIFGTLSRPDMSTLDASAVANLVVRRLH